MKKDWEIKKLGEVCEIECGTRVVRKVDGGSIYPVYGGGGATFKMDTYNREDCLIVSRFAMSENCTRFVKGKFFLNDSGLSLKANENVIYQKYLETVILGKNDEIYSLGRGAAQKNLDMTRFRELAIPYPQSLSEQKRIVKILDEKFAHLETIKANAQINLQNAKDLFQSKLTKAFSNTTWEKKRLETITKIKSGFAFKGSAFKTTGEYQVLRLGNVKQNYLRIDEKAVFVSGISTSDLLKAKVNIGDLVVTQTGTKGKRDYGFVAIVDRDNLLLNQRLAAITTVECLYNRYLLYYSYTESFKDQFFANEGGTVGQGNIGLTDIKEIEIPLPPLPEQKRIVKELDTLSEKVRQLQEIYTKQIANCEELKQALLKKAFEGEL